MSMSIALIGCGRIAKKSHTKAIIDNSNLLQCRYACDLEIENANSFTRTLEACGLRRALVTKNYEDVLTDDSIDGVVVAVESGNHYRIVVEALDSGKHVLVEKPLALSTKHMNTMIQKARLNGLTLAVCHQNRFNPPVRCVRKKIEAGDFGKILYGTVQIRWSRDEVYYSQAPWRGTWKMDGGALMNQSIHGIDLLQWILGGDVEEVYGIVSKMKHPYIEAEDFGAAILKFKSGAVGIIEATTNVYPRNLEERLSVFGERGTAEIGGLAVNRIQTWMFDGENRHPLMDLPDPDTVYGNSHSEVYRDFHDAILNSKEPYVNGEEGKKAVDIVLAIYKSYKEKRPIRIDALSWSTDEMIDSLEHRR